MSGFDSYVGGGDELAGGPTRPFDDGYFGYDPRLPSQRFDSSFRSPDQFPVDDTDADADEVKDADDFDNGNRYEVPPAPVYHSEDEAAPQQLDTPPMFSQSFGSSFQHVDLGAITLPKPLRSTTSPLK